jgi:long-chain acyl-CoA synthetase
MDNRVIPDFLTQWANQAPDRVWLRDRQGDHFDEWTWLEAKEEIDAVANWLEREFPAQTKIAILSRNRAHWILADLAGIGAGHVIVPLFTTLPRSTAQYILEFSEVDLLFLGEAENWERIQTILPDHVKVITLPGVDHAGSLTRWEDILTQSKGQTPEYRCEPEEMVSLVFTSGTTGEPKGVIQTHDSMLIPTARFDYAFQLRKNPRFFSFLPLSHVAERQLVEMQSIITCGVIDFNESLETLNRDMKDCQPNFFFGAPRVWEQLQQAVLSGFGSQAAMDAALAQNAGETAATVRQNMGLSDTDYMLTAAAPISTALIDWYEKLDLQLMEGYGQTEAMGLIANRKGERKVGTIGRNIDVVEVRLSKEGELQVKGPGLCPGYYKSPEKTAETFVDGWVYTGDKAWIDDEGYVTLTGRMKEYFKTIHGKFVAPVPIEDAFSDNPYTEQLCLIGRGYSKTVMVCSLTELAQSEDKSIIAEALCTLASKINSHTEKHARIGVIMVCPEPWSIENRILTPTLKIRREEIDERFGPRAAELALEAAKKHEILIEWL